MFGIVAVGDQRAVNPKTAERAIVVLSTGCGRTGDILGEGHIAPGTI
jgi:hypothetical protein